MAASVTTQKRFDLIVYGATGFTGRLACEYLQEKYHHGNGNGNGNGNTVSWAMAGRSKEKLEALRSSLGLGEEIPIIVADAKDAGAMDELISQTKAIANYAGTPFIDKALPIVEACCRHGTHYCDITGEVALSRASYDRYNAAAVASKALIIHNTGYDSVPSDLGAMLAADAMRERHGRGCANIRLVNREASGGVSGGTIATAMMIMTQGSSLPGAAEMKGRGSYPLDPEAGKGGVDVRDGPRLPVEWDELAQTWVVPSVMAGVNAPIVRKSNALMDYKWGEKCSYSEVSASGGRFTALGTVAAMGVGGLAVAFPPTRWALLRWALPKPGQGPDPQSRNRGFFHCSIHAVGETGPDDATQPPVTVAHVRSGDGGDPGYKCTARMSVEAALTTVLDREQCAEGGVLTPASGLGMALVGRLNRSGMQLTID